MEVSSEPSSLEHCGFAFGWGRREVAVLTPASKWGFASLSGEAQGPASFL